MKIRNFEYIQSGKLDSEKMEEIIKKVLTKIARDADETGSMVIGIHLERL